jgi:hypothetical protein
MDVSLSDFLTVFVAGSTIILAAVTLLQRAREGKLDGWTVGFVACLAAFSGVALYMMTSGLMKP